MPKIPRFTAKHEAGNDDEETPVIKTRTPVAKKAAKAPKVSPRDALREAMRSKLSPILEKQGGKVGSADTLSDLHKPRGYTPTGIYGLDILLSGGRGIPWGRFLEVYGAESSGKSATAEFIMSAVDQAGGIVHHIDTEMTRDDARIEKCYGLTTQDFEDVDAPDLESVWDYAYGVAKVLQSEKATTPNLIVLDSLAATPARDELDEKGHDSSHVGLQARANSKGVRKTVRLFAASSCIFIFINQLRDKIGAMGYGPKTDTPGGRALKYAYSIRLQVSRKESIKSGETIVGQLVEIHSQKNKHAPPRMKTCLVLSYKTGIDVTASNLEWFRTRGVLKHKGKEWYFAGENIGGKDNFAQWCQENQEKVEEAVAQERDEILAEFAGEATEGGDEDA